MSEKIEGTIVLDGLIEGRFSDGEETVENLNGWVKFVRSTLGLRFSLEASGDAFSMLPDNEAAAVDKLGADPQDAIRQALEQLVAALPQQDRRGVFSTLRSAEVRKGEEVQTLYAVQGDGSATMESRTVEAKTVAPVEPLTTKQKVKLGVIGVAIAAVVLVLIFVLFPGLREKLGQKIKPVNAQDIALDAAAYREYFTVEIKEASRTRAVLVVTPTDNYPKDDAAAEAAYKNADTLARRLAIEAIVRGYVRVECYNDEGVLYSWEPSPMARVLTEHLRRLEKQKDQKKDREKADEGKEEKRDPRAVEVPIILSPDGKQRIERIILRY